MRNAKHEAGEKAALPAIDLHRGLLLAGSDKALYRSFLLDYPQDDTVSRLTAALDAGDLAEAALLAHTLKGLAAQLGMEEVCQSAQALLNALRGGRPFRDPARRVLRAHERVLRALSPLPPEFHSL